MWVTWVSAVRGLTNSAAAISGLERPSTRSRRTSRSRGVSWVLSWSEGCARSRRFGGDQHPVHLGPDLLRSHAIADLPRPVIGVVADPLACRRLGVFVGDSFWQVAWTTEGHGFCCAKQPGGQLRRTDMARQHRHRLQELPVVVSQRAS